MARKSPEINAASMADIAFLLLCFFLVSTTFDSDKGLLRFLPPINNDNKEASDIRQRNMLRIEMNANDQMLVNNEYTKIGELREKVKKHIDNGAGNNLGGADHVAECTYCEGDKSPGGSESPENAIVAVQGSAQTSYKMYVAVNNEIDAAYHELFDQISNKKFGMDYIRLDPDKQAEISTKYYPKHIVELRTIDAQGL